MTLFTRTLLIAIFLSPALSLAAENSFSWSELAQKARQSNEELKASEQSLQSSEYQSKGAASNFYPQISAGVSATQSTTDEFAVSLSATQNVFAGFQDSGKVSQSKASFEVAKANLQSAKAKVSYDLKSAVANLLYAQKYVKLSESILQRRELNLRQVQLRFDGGRENKGSLLLSKAYLEDARLDHLQAEQALFVAQGQLAKVLGDEEPAAYNFQGIIPISEPLKDSQIGFQNLVLETPSYRIAVAQEEISKASVTLAEANFYPSLNLNATTSQYGGTWYPDQNRWSVGATLSVPLFNGGRDYFATRSALQSLRASAFTKSSTQKDQVVKLKSFYVSFVQSLQKLKVDQAYLEAADLREKISRQKYNNGLSSFDDWDLIESDLIRRQKSILQSEKDRVVTEAAWEQAQGKGVL
jgi:outer membrane protein